MDEILTKLDARRKEFTTEEDVTILNEWESKARVAVMTSNLQNNDAMKIILAKYKKEIADITLTLSSDATLFADEKGRHLGQLLHERKKWCRQFLKIFWSAEDQVKGVSNALDNL